MVKIVAITGFLCIWLNAQSSTLKDSIEIVQRELDSTLKSLDDLTRIMNELGADEKRSLDRLEYLQERIAITEKLIRQLDAQIDRRNREINEVNARLAKILQEQEKCRMLLIHRLRGIYKFSKVFPLQAFLTSKNLPELYRRVLTLRLISRCDYQLIVKLTELNKEMNLHRQSIIAAKIAAESLKVAARNKRAELMQDMDEANRFLTQIRTEKATRSAVQSELAAATERLKVLIVQLQGRATTEEEKPYFEKNRGKLPWPVSGSIITSFGTQIHPRYRTKINNTGIDIKVKEPSPVKVVAAGKVSYADRFTGYGNLVIIEHGDGYFTLYGNLTGVETVVNALVSQGTVIGTVVDYLHFEVRKEGQPLNPKEWLE